MPFWNDATWAILYKPGHVLQKIGGTLNGMWNRTTMLFSLRSYDFIFIHREALPIGPPIFEWVIAKVFGEKIIYDFDDAIWLPDMNQKSKLFSFIKSPDKVRVIAKWSYRVSCGNKYLSEFARNYNSNVVLNPTTIDTDNLHYLYGVLSDKKKKGK